MSPGRTRARSAANEGRESAGVTAKGLVECDGRAPATSFGWAKSLRWASGVNESDHRLAGIEGEGSVAGTKPTTIIGPPQSAQRIRGPAGACCGRWPRSTKTKP